MNCGMYRIAILIISVSFFQNPLAAQDTGHDSIPQEGLGLMQHYASKQQYEDARDLGYRMLQNNPLNHDVSLLLARIYGWEGKYDSAFAIVNRVISMAPELVEPHLVRVDLAYWENDWPKLEAYAKTAMELDPGSRELREKYLLAKYQLGLNSDVPELQVAYFYDHFGQPYVRNWHMLTLGGSVPVGRGHLLPYINGGYQPGVEGVSTDIQFNLDAYLHLGSKNYILVGGGLSPHGTTDYLPSGRAALELWQVLPAGFALSAGARYFYWDEPFTFFTLSAEKYAGDYWLALRSYLFSKDHGISTSWYLSARRYLANRFNYLTATIGYGTAPDEPLLVVSDLDRLSALSFRAGFSWKVSHNLRWYSLMGYSYEEFTDREYRHRPDFRTGLYIGLKR
jgi:YaiO family outer membrane protein